MTPLAVQLYTVRDRLAEDRAGTLARLADIGYRAVEPFDPLTDPAGTRSRLDDLGLTVPAVHAPLLGPDRAALFDAVATLGADTAIVASVPRERWADADGVRAIAADFAALAADAAGHGLRVGYHNHWWEFADLAGRPALEVFADALPAEVVLEVDVYWAAVAGADVPSLLTRLGDRARFLHVKDGSMNSDDPQTAVGAGALPIAAILAAGAAAEWWVVELDDCAGDPYEALAASHRYLSDPGGPAE